MKLKFAEKNKETGETEVVTRDVRTMKVVDPDTPDDAAPEVNDEDVNDDDEPPEDFAPSLI